MQSIVQPGTSFGSSVRTQVILFGVLVVIFAVVSTQAITILTTQNEIEQDSAVDLSTIANNEAELITRELQEQVQDANVLAGSNNLGVVVRQSNRAYEGEGDDEIVENLITLDNLWLAASDQSTQVRTVLNNTVSLELREAQLEYSDLVEIFVTDRYGAVVAATNRTSDYLQSDEDWWIAAWNNGTGATYLDSQPTFDESTNSFILIMAVPVIDQNEVIGVLRTSYRLNTIQEVIRDTRFGDSGYAVVVNSDGQVLVDENTTSSEIILEEVIPLLDGSLDEESHLVENVQGNSAYAAHAVITTDGREAVIDSLNWNVIVFQDEDEVLTPISEALATVALPIVGIILLASFGSYLLARRIVRPLGILERAAQKLSNQEWDTRVDLPVRNEFGELAYAFNLMAGQLEGLVDQMEQRISERTRDLQAVVDVSNQISTLLDLNRLLQDVVDLTKERFRLYHAHIYLLDANNETLTLAAGAGHVGRQMVSEKRTIALQNQRSIVATAGRTRESVLINDVQQTEAFLPHPLLPDTRAELAVPLIARGQLVGVLDVQSDHANYFDEQILPVMETLSSQVAVALSNATLYQVAERTSRHEQALGTITQRLQGAANVEEVLQVAVRELGKALRVPHTAIQLDTTTDGTNRTN